MECGKNIFVVGIELFELEDGQLVKSSIKMPDNVTYILTSLDCKIIAFGSNISKQHLIHELIDREFVLRHKFSKYLMGIPGHEIEVNNCLYVQNILIIKKEVHRLPIYHIINLETNNIILLCYGIFPYCCDGIVTIPPISEIYNNQYHTFDLMNKKITNDCPYFMQKYNQLALPYLIMEIRSGNGFTVIENNKVYYTITGTLLCTGQVSEKFHCYGNYVISGNKLTIAKDAPVVEYTCGSGDSIYYVYTIKSSGHATKAAIPAISDS